MSPLVGLFQQRCVQEMVERVLYIWAIRSQAIIIITDIYKNIFIFRHPASGYVQGINDLVTPFLMVFLQVDKRLLEFFSLASAEHISFSCMLNQQL